MTEVELARDEPDVGLGGGEPVVQRVRERTLVLVVVVGVRPLQRLDRGPVRWGGDRARHGDEPGAQQRGEQDEDAGERHTTSAVHRVREP